MCVFIVIYLLCISPPDMHLCFWGKCFIKYIYIKKLFNVVFGYIFYCNVYTLDCCLLYCTIHFRVLKYLVHYSSLFCAQFCTTALHCFVRFHSTFCPDLWNCKSFLQGQGYVRLSNYSCSVLILLSKTTYTIESNPSN